MGRYKSVMNDDDGAISSLHKVMYSVKAIAKKASVSVKSVRHFNVL